MKIINGRIHMISHELIIEYHRETSQLWFSCFNIYWYLSGSNPFAIESFPTKYVDRPKSRIEYPLSRALRLVMHRQKDYSWEQVDEAE